MKRLFSFTLVAALAGLLAACVTTGSQVAAPPAEPVFSAQDIQDTEIVGTDSLPGHAKLVLAALLQTMRGQPIDGVKRVVSFSSDGEHELSFADMDYTGYGVALTEFNEVAFVKRPAGGLSVGLGGVFTFMNDIGQTFSDRFFADYVINKNGTIVIQDSSISPLFTEYPTVTGFFVRNEILKQAAPRLNSFREFYLFALANAVPMQATEEQTRNMAKYDTLSFFDKMSNSALLPRPEEGNFAFLCFVMDRMLPFDHFTLKSSKSQSPRGSSSTTPRYFEFPGGYRLGILQGKGKLFDKLHPYYIHALYSQAGAANGAELQMGLFSNQLLPADVERLSAPPGSEWMTAKLEQGPQKEMRLLNPADREDAKRIQRALAQQGYYTGQIDGMFGKGSQGALRAYRKAVMGSDSAQWDMNVQKRLQP